MTPERWEQVGEIYHRASELGEAERQLYIEQACAGDDELRREVVSLLEAEQRAGRFIESTAIDDAARALAGQSNPIVIGTEFCHYKILERLGEGGMGEVYLARDSRLNRRVAIKLLPPSLTADAHIVARFEREARAVSALNHPNIITIHEVGNVDGTRFLVTEFIDGSTVRERIASSNLTLTEALDIIIQVAGALVAAHAVGIVHRDIKPENVMVRPDGVVKVLDFGLAKSTTAIPLAYSEFSTNAPTEFRTNPEARTIMGTPRYMSPEQARGLDTDGRSDIFSLGVMLYEMVTGRAPFTGDTPTDVIVAVVARDPPAPGGPIELQDAIRKTLSKDRDARHSSASELLQELERLRKSHQIDNQAGPVTLPITEVALPKRQSFDPRAVTTTESKHVRRPTRRVVTWLRSHAMTLALVIGAALVASVVYELVIMKGTPVSTGRYAVLLADFENSTGDSELDGILKQALAVQIDQTQFLSLISNDRVRESLRSMGLPVDSRLTREVAREIARRQGLRYIVIGSIARSGSPYSITLETLHTDTGQAVARGVAEATSKERILLAIAAAATQLRAQLSETAETK